MFMSRTGKTRFGRALRKLIKSERGAVYAEAAITLPFFIMIWAFMIFSHKLVHEKIKNNAIAKGCAWNYAVIQYCEGAPACTGDTSVADAPPVGWDSSSVDSFLSDIPGVRSLVDAVLGKGAFVRRNSSVNKPGYIGGGSASIHSQHSVSCNQKPTSVGEILRRLVSRFIPIF
jgi:hypothetical protein